MPRAVMTKQAVDGIDAKEHRSGVNGAAIVGVLHRAHWYRSPDQPIRSAVYIIVAFNLDHLLNHLVIMCVHGNGLPDVLVGRSPGLLVTSDIRRCGVVLVKIFDTHRPPVVEVIAPYELLNKNVT